MGKPTYKRLFTGSLFCLAALPTWSETIMGGVTLRPSDALTHTYIVPLDGNAAIVFPALARPQDWLPNQARCTDATRTPAWQQLALGDAVEFVLCQSTTLRQALATISEQEGAVTLGRTAFLPRVTANAEFSTDRIPSNNSAASPLGSSVTGALGLSWTLFDFGLRDASLSAARAALSAALFSQDNVVLQTLTEVLRLYVEAATAWARLDTTIETERVAGLTEEIASARHAAAVGTLLEKLQAQTARSQAALERVRAQVIWDVARGALASAMGRPVSQPMALAPLRGLRGIAEGDLQFARSREGIAQHPRIRALQSEREAAQARLEVIRAEGRGTIALNSNLGVTRTLSGGSGTGRALGASVSASVPLFNRTEQQAREQQVLAQISAREALLTAAEREIELELWRATQLAAGEAENVRASRRLLDNANTAYSIAFGRFKSGVGSILEMLSAQNALASANSSATQAEITALAARIRLSLASGRMQLAKP